MVNGPYRFGVYLDPPLGLTNTLEINEITLTFFSNYTFNFLKYSESYKCYFIFSKWKFYFMNLNAICENYKITYEHTSVKSWTSDQYKKEKKPLETWRYVIPFLKILALNILVYTFHLQVLYMHVGVFITVHKCSNSLYILLKSFQVSNFTLWEVILFLFALNFSCSV